MDRSIKTKADYEAALARIDQLMGAESGTVESEELDRLATLVELYEEEHFPIPKPDPIDVIKFVMDQNDLTPEDLVPYIGSRGLVLEVLTGKRKLTESMVRDLSRHLDISADLLLVEPESSLPEQR